MTSTRVNARMSVEHYREGYKVMRFVMPSDVMKHPEEMDRVSTFLLLVHTI